jgi:hypothetical protein
MERDLGYMESLFCGKVEKACVVERWKGIFVLALSVRA